MSYVFSWRIFDKINSRHMKQHSRPFKCEVNGCTRAFSLKTGLENHINSVHRQPPYQKRWYCLEVGCKYTLAINGTARKDSLNQHMKTMHGGSAS